MKQPKTAMIGFRYHSEKKDFLVKAYGKELPGIMRKLSDDLIVKAVEKTRIKTK